MTRQLLGEYIQPDSSDLNGNIVAECVESYSNVLKGTVSRFPLVDGDYDFNLPAGKYKFSVEITNPPSTTVVKTVIIGVGTVPDTNNAPITINSSIAATGANASIVEAIVGAFGSSGSSGTILALNNQEILDGVGTTAKLVSAAQLKMAVEAFANGIIPVTTPPTANFTLNNTILTSPATFVITDASIEGTYPIVSRVLTFDDNSPDVNLSGSYNLLVNTPSTTVVVTLTVTDSNGTTHSKTSAVSTSATVNNPPVIYDQSFITSEGSNLTITLGPLTDDDGDMIAYSFTGATGGVQGDTPNKIVFNNISMGTRTITVEADDGRGGVDTATVTVLVTPASVGVSNNYVLGYDAIEPDFGSGMPAKGVKVIDATTGCPLTRVVDSSTDMQQSTQSVNGYSRYSQENSNGTLFIAQGTNSTSSTIINKATGAVVAYLAYDDSGTNTHTIGMLHEMRWDKTGNHPNRIYFTYGMKLYQIDDVTQNNNTDRSNPTRSVIKDFTNEITWPVGAAAYTKKIYNDQEGDCSLDCDHWAFMAAYYDGSNWRCAAIVHYQISTDTTHVLYPSDLAGSNMDAFKNDDYFPKRPNMVEISPLASGLIIHTGRSYTGWNENTIDTWFDGPYMWPLDFDWVSTAPLKVSISETHSGWAWAEDGRELFVSQDNRRDRLIAVYVTGANKGYGLPNTATIGQDAGAGCIDFANHADLDYTGFHFVQMPQSKRGWIAVSMYSNSDDPMDDQIAMFEIKPLDQSPRIWRIAPMYSKYLGNYWDEAPASINMDGTAIYVSQNWGVGDGAHNEIFRYDLPSDWHEHLTGGSSIVYGDTIVVTGIEVQ